MAAKKEENQLAITENTDQLPAEFLDELAADAGAGQEEMTKDDLAIPRIKILQSNSPECSKGEAEYIKASEVGDFFNTVSKQLISGETGMLVIPISYRRAYIEWVPQDEGGGFVADHGSDDTALKACTKNDKGQDITADGHQIVTTAEYFAFIVDGETGDAEPVVISMSSTQLKKARQWNTMINNYKVANPKGQKFNPAMFYRAYHFTTIPEKNEKGSWLGFKVVPSVDTIKIVNGVELYKAAREFHIQVRDGNVKASEADVTEASGSSSAEVSDDTPM